MKASARGAMVTLAIAAGLMAGCGSDGGDGGGGGSQQDLTSYEPGKKLVKKVDEETFPVPEPAGDYLIGVTLPHLNDEYWIAMAAGIEAEAKELGVETRVQAADGYGDTAGQTAQMETFLTQGVDAIIVGAVDNEGIVPVVERAWSEGVPVIYAGALANSDKLMGVFSDDALGGQREAAYVAEQDPDARVVAFCGPAGVIWPKLRCEGFIDELKRLAPDAEVVAEKYHDMDRAVIGDVAANTLQGQPDANWIFASTDLAAKGVFDALRARGEGPGEIPVVNMTMGREYFGLFEEGWAAHASAEQPVLVGKLAVDQSVMVLNGEQPPAQWAIDLPGYASTPAGIEKFDAEGKRWNFAPPDYSPSS